MNRLLTSVIVLTVSVISLFAQPSKKELAAIDATVMKAFRTFGTTGLSVAVTSGGNVIYKQALGFSDAAKKDPVTTGSLFNIASCSKAFTAAAVSMLVDEGKIKWTDKVTQYFPEFRLADDYITRELTVEDLLCHRSGLGTFYGDLLWYASTYTDEEVMNRIRYEPVTRRFGIQYGYQNVMFLVAGRIVEKVSGKTWSEFVTERIFSPLGMNQTRPSNDELSDDQKIAYGHLSGKPLETLDFNAAKAAAGIYSSVDELTSWTRMLLDRGVSRGKRLLSQNSIDRMMEPHTILGTSPTQKQRGINFNSYGLGWYVSDYNGEKIVEHDGGMPGYISKVLLVPARGISIIVLNNGNDFFINNAIKYDLLDILVKGRDFDWTAEYSGIRMQNEAAEKIALETRAKSRVTGTSPSHKPEELAGIYNDRSYGDAEVAVSGGTMTLTFLPSKKMFTGNLEHWHYDTYKVVFKDEYLTYGLVTFNFDEKGKTAGFKIDLPSADFHFWNLDFRKTR